MVNFKQHNFPAPSRFVYIMMVVMKNESQNQPLLVVMVMRVSSTGGRRFAETS